MNKLKMNTKEIIFVHFLSMLSYRVPHSSKNQFCGGIRGLPEEAETATLEPLLSEHA